MHPQIASIVAGLVKRKKYVYLCTNGLLLKEKLDEFQPSKYFSFVVHMDGLREHHDFAVCREGTYDIAVDGIREALKRGFRLTTNTTLFDGADPKSVRQFFDGFGPQDCRRRNAVYRQGADPRRISSTLFPISAVLVVVCFPISVQARRVGKILEGFNNPSGLKTRFTRIIISRSGSVKTRFMNSFFS